MKTMDKTLLVAVALSGLMGACATVAPSQLIEARGSYVAATTGLPGKLIPTQLYDAKQILDKANQEFAARGDTPTCRDYAYIAENKLELADVMAQTELDRQTVLEAARFGAGLRDGQREGRMLSSSNP